MRLEPDEHQSNLIVSGRTFAIYVTEHDIGEVSNTRESLTFTAAVSEDGEIELVVTNETEPENIVSAELSADAIQTSDTTLRVAFTLFNNDTLFKQRESFQKLPDSHGGILSVQVSTNTESKPSLRNNLRLQFGGGNVSLGVNHYLFIIALGQC